MQLKLEEQAKLSKINQLLIPTLHLSTVVRILKKKKFEVIEKWLIPFLPSAVNNSRCTKQLVTLININVTNAMDNDANQKNLPTSVYILRQILTIKN